MTQIELRLANKLGHELRFGRSAVGGKVTTQEMRKVVDVTVGNSWLASGEVKLKGSEWILFVLGKCKTIEEMISNIMEMQDVADEGLFIMDVATNTLQPLNLSTLSNELGLLKKAVESNPLRWSNISSTALSTNSPAEMQMHFIDRLTGTYKDYNLKAHVIKLLEVYARYLMGGRRSLNDRV